VTLFRSKAEQKLVDKGLDHNGADYWKEQRYGF